MGEPTGSAKTWQCTSITIRGGAPISLTVRPTVSAAYDRARVRAGAPNRSAWAEGVILAATEGLYDGNAHERLHGAAEALDLPERTLLRLWLMAACDEDVTRSMVQARAYQLVREK